jgi:penicillin amidase
MTWLLAGPGWDRSMTLTREALGEETTEALFPQLAPFPEPIVPAGTPWTFEPLPVPETPPSTFWDGGTTGEAEPAEPAEPEARGSNNWAVAGSKTRSGYPILADDMHLPLTLPATWYEMQLTAPGVHVYGVTLPGAPTVIVGFNRDVAWGPTNSETDVLDFYHVRFNDDSRSEYFHDGEWKPVTWRTEVIKVRDRESIIERVPYTHHGPVVYTEGQSPYSRRVPIDAAMRWTAHDPSNEVAAFHLLDRARNHDDYVAALRLFEAPGQNFAYADRHGDIAIRQQGKFPLRWPGQGRYVLDGTDPAHDWQGWIPADHVPHLHNPESGMVFSANQNPVGPDYPYPMVGSYGTAYRARRIRERLEEMTPIDPGQMIALQGDTLSVYARDLLPTLIGLVEEAELDDVEREQLEELRSWNYEYRAELTAPTVFEYWQQALLGKIWSDDIDRDNGMRRPRRDVTVTLILDEPDSPWFDDRATPERETIADVALASFRTALDKMQSMLGPPGERWRWGTARGTDIRHIGRIPGFGTTRLPTDGQYGVLRANTSGNGPSWQMVVALGDEPRAWGIYPGGQSGNPGSPHYDDFVDDWVEGKVYELLVLESPDDPRAADLGKAVMR